MAATRTDTDGGPQETAPGGGAVEEPQAAPAESRAELSAFSDVFAAEG
ncbi:hypothetical protein OG552_07045 [Streptomyces sp. NBC_01476]|nr:hypothetical protein [Streptomyces sp. NBC_01476]